MHLGQMFSTIFNAVLTDNNNLAVGGTGVTRKVKETTDRDWSKSWFLSDVN